MCWPVGWRQRRDGKWASPRCGLAVPRQNGKNGIIEMRELMRRLRDEDGKGTSGWSKHLRMLGRRSDRLTKLGLRRLELRGPGTELDVGFVTGTRWLGGPEELVDLDVAPGWRTASW